MHLAPESNQSNQYIADKWLKINGLMYCEQSFELHSCHNILAKQNSHTKKMCFGVPLPVVLKCQVTALLCIYSPTLYSPTLYLQYISHAQF